MTHIKLTNRSRSTRKEALEGVFAYSTTDNPAALREAERQGHIALVLQNAAEAAAKRRNAIEGYINGHRVTDVGVYQAHMEELRETAAFNYDEEALYEETFSRLRRRRIPSLTS